MYSVLNRKICCKPPLLSSKTSFPDLPKFLNLFTNSIPRLFSSTGDDPNFNWDAPTGSSWSTGLTKDHFDGEAVGHQITPPGPNTPVPKPVPIPIPGPVSAPVATGNRRPQQVPGTRQKSQYWNKGSGSGGSDKREMEMALLLKQIEDPGARGSYLKDSEKAEMYKKHKADPKVYTIEKLAEEYRIMRQRVCAILWLKEDEEEEAKKRGEPLDDSIEQLIDTFPHFFNSHDREYHVASLPYKPDFKVMPEGWDGTTRDPDEVHYEISKKEDDMLYEEFCLRFNFNKMKFKNLVKVHKYSRKRPSNGWEFVVTKVGPRGKRGAGGGWKFVSQPDGSTRPLNEVEKMYVKRETPRRRRKILP